MLEEPKDVQELFYYTDRDVDSGYAKVWVFKLKCPKCGTPMQKPRNKQGKPIKKATYYECPDCGFKMEAKEYESKLIANIKYKCPYCGYEGELQVPFKRKKVKGVEAFVFKCQKCGKDIFITKKFKKLKSKKK